MPYGEIVIYRTRAPRRYAYIKPNFDDRLIFVPSIALDELHREPRRGDRVRFRIQTNDKGQRRAIDLALIHRDPLR